MLWVFIITILGACLGSFLNVCIHRLPLNKSIVFPPSHCIVCGTRLRTRDLIPLISYFLLKGRCQNCSAKISIRYVVVEVVTVICLLSCYYVLGTSAEFYKFALGALFLILISFIDYNHQLILDKVLLWFASAGFFIQLFFFDISIIDMISACLVGGTILLIIAILTKGGMGGGDIKFMAALGVWLGLKLTLLTLFLSFVIGGIGSLLLLAFKIKGRKDFIPFGPFIAVAAFISMLYGNEIIAWYLNLL